MKVRGWIIIGNAVCAYHLPPGKDIFHGDAPIGEPLPDAMRYQPGDWMRWSPCMGAHIMTLVCVEIPL